jgi:hypothetical protein
MTTTTTTTHDKAFVLLKGLQAADVDKKYTLRRPLPSDSRTHVSELTSLRSEPSDHGTFSYLDEAKREHTCVLTMVDIHHGRDVAPSSSSISCFWCRHPFSHPPLGCPVGYVSQRTEKKEQERHLRENVPEDVFERIHSRLIMSTVISRPYYITDGVFCSFPCCLAFIDDRRHDPLYRDSSMLLRQMFYSVFDLGATFIKAPSWRLLTTYGGPLTIQEYRKGLSSTHYVDCDHVIQRPLHYVFERHITL